MALRIRGTIHQLGDKGGIIRAAAVSDFDYFFDRRSLSGVTLAELHRGQVVVFDEDLTVRRGPRASKVSVP